MGENEKVGEFSFDLNDGDWSVGLVGEDGGEMSCGFGGAEVASLVVELGGAAAAADKSNGM
jgi:hypothetical protein